MRVKTQTSESPGGLISIKNEFQFNHMCCVKCGALRVSVSAAESLILKTFNDLENELSPCRFLLHCEGKSFMFRALMKSPARPHPPQCGLKKKKKHTYL